MLIKKITTNYKQTQKLGEKMAKEVLALRQAQDKNNSAVVFGLQGNLGGGKTTFLQGFSKGLGIKEKILSPTFVILKHFKITKSQIPNPKSQTNSKFQILNSKFTDFYHIDCYRLKNEKDILALMGFSAKGGPASGWKKIIENPKNIIAIEWPEKIKRILPKNIIYIKFTCPEQSRRVDKNKREIKIKI